MDTQQIKVTAMPTLSSRRKGRLCATCQPEWAAAILPLGLPTWPAKNWILANECPTD